MGDLAANARTAATIKEGVRSLVRLRTAPRPIPGNVVELLHSAKQISTNRLGGWPLTDIVFLPVMFNWGEWRSSGHKHFPVSPVIQVLRFCFMQPCGIRQREDDRTLDVFCHLLHYIFSERSWYSRSTNQNVGFDLFNNGVQVIVVLVLPLSILSSIRKLRRGKLVLLRLEQKTRLVNAPV